MNESTVVPSMDDVLVSDHLVIILMKITVIITTIIIILIILISHLNNSEITLKAITYKQGSVSSHYCMYNINNS